MPPSRSAATPTDAPTRLVALGASNLTRLLPDLARRSGAAEVLCACGYGRSYGASSWFLLRRRGGIDGSALWAELDLREPAPTLGIVTDVGNDILYGFPPDWIRSRVEACLARLAPACEQLVLTGLPLDSVARVGALRWWLLRTVLVPGCRVSLSDARRGAEQVDSMLRELATRWGARFVELPGAWYGLDPIHVRRAARDAWLEAVLGHGVAPGTAPPPRPSASTIRRF